MNKLLLPAVSLLLLAGAGCVDLPDKYPSTDLNLTSGSVITLVQKPLTILPSKKSLPYWTVTINNAAPGSSLNGVWTKHESKETDVSVAARAAAEHSGIGDQAQDVPDPVYAEVTTNGSFSTQALDDAADMTLPALWPADSEFKGGEMNSVLWLSQTQYSELVATRHTHLEPEILGMSLTNLLNTAGGLKNLLSKVGGPEIPNIEPQDLTEIEAAKDWATYSVKVNGDNKQLQVIEAGNRFADYVILANPQNPLILEIKPTALTLGANLFVSLGNIPELSGYQVTELNGFTSAVPTNANPPQPQAE